ncbi:MAG: hypothetical protein HKN59_06170 [Gammaproteobacteria bacterium]|nr:hypothetical protein [Gammaproteobacteria bacterium]
MKKWLKQTKNLAFIVLMLSAGAVKAGAADTGAAMLASLNATELTARDIKTLHYVQNAHGQLDEWSFRLLSRLKKGQGPREREPILDGRADLQVQKIAVTYAGYTHTDALKETLAALADAHEKRLRVLQAMTVSDVDAERFKKLNAPVQELVAALREWSEKR